VDIWAVGCIFFELALRRKAFEDDWRVLEYLQSFDTNSMSFLNDLDSEATVAQRSHEVIKTVIGKMLDVEAANRPTARELHGQFASLYGSGMAGLGEAGPISEEKDMFQCACNETSSVARGTTVSLLISDK
jgi:serine/threonine protein kinase